MEERFAVIDTETTWGDDVMSIGVVIADGSSFEAIDNRYYILLPYRDHGGMYTDALYVRGLQPHLECSRREVLGDLKSFLGQNQVRKMFAYNALFDRGHLPELRQFQWFDIMKIAAYRQYNHSIPEYADCCSTGRLKRGYGVENIYRMLSGDGLYAETHNALFDAVDELTIMKLLAVEIEIYNSARL